MSNPSLRSRLSESSNHCLPASLNNSSNVNNVNGSNSWSSNNTNSTANAESNLSNVPAHLQLGNNGILKVI